MYKTVAIEVITGYFTSDNEPGGIENATHNTFPKLTLLKPISLSYCFKMILNPLWLCFQ
jgi:hypothetical protein